MKVEIFEESTGYQLAKSINLWIERNVVDVVQVQYQAFYNQQEEQEVFTALVTYR